MGLIHDIPTCYELLNRIEREAVTNMQRLTGMVQDENTLAEPVNNHTQSHMSSTDNTSTKINNPAAEIWGIGKSKL